MLKQKQTQEQLINYYDFLNFFHNKWSLFFKGIYNNEKEKYEYFPLKYNEIINLRTKGEKTNLFFTINKFSKDRKSKNLKCLNCFYFDLDLKENNEDVKYNIESIIEKTKDFFDIIIKSRWWYHFYKLLNDWEYELDEVEKYKNDWKKLWNNLEILFWIKLDDKIYDVSRISRIPYSYHQKKENNDLFLIEIIKWKEIISPLNERLKEILKTLIICVLEKLVEEWLINDLQIKNWIIYRNGEVSDWLKIFEEDNFIKDFSYDYYIWNPFSLVQKLYFEKIEKYYFEKNIKKEKSELNSASIIETYSFFWKYFWILNQNIVKKNIVIPQIIEKILVDLNLSNIELKYFLWLLNYSQWKNNNTYYIWKEIKIELNEFIKYNSFDINTSKNKEYLEKLFWNLIFQKNKENNFDILKWEIIKENKKLFLIYTIIPWFHNLWNITKNKFYFKHYINKNILNIATNWSYLNFIFWIFRNLINIKDKNELVFEKEKIIETIWDSNFQRIKKKLLEINKDLWDIFEIKREWKNIALIKK